MKTNLFKILDEDCTLVYWTALKNIINASIITSFLKIYSQQTDKTVCNRTFIYSAETTWKMEIERKVMKENIALD